VAYEFPGPNPMAEVIPSRKAQDFFDWLEDNVGVAFVDVQQAVFWMISNAIAGTGDWYFRSDGGSNVLATTPTSMQVTLKAGFGFLNGVPLYIAADITSDVFVAPNSDPRIDVLAIDADTRLIVIFEGAEDPAPVAPAVTGNCVGVAEIYHRVGETTIKQLDDSVNGYITNLYMSIQAFTDADATPSVLAAKLISTPTTVAAPYNITMFHDGYRGQEITLIGYNPDCTVKQGSNLKINGDWTATAYCTLRLLFGGTNWFEISRSPNA